MVLGGTDWIASCVMYLQRMSDGMSLLANYIIKFMLLINIYNHLRVNILFSF